MFITTSGTGKINIKTGDAVRLNIGNTGVVSFANHLWHSCINGNARFYYAPSATTYIRGHGSSPIEFRDGGDNALMRLNNNGSVNFYNGITTLAQVDSVGNWSCNLVTYSGSGHDYVGVLDVLTSTLQNNYRVLRGMISTFTGYHRCYVEDELFNEENVDIFKNEYMGRIVISTLYW